MNPISLFNEFPEVSSKAWKQKIQYELKGKDYNEALVWESPEGIKVKPFYHADDLPDVRHSSTVAKNPWNIGQVIYAGNAIMANQNAQRLLKRGAEALRFSIPSETIDIRVLLKDIDLHKVYVYLELKFLSIPYSTKISKLHQDRQNLFLQIDPIGHLSRSGNWFTSMSSDFDTLDALLELPLDNMLSIDLSLYQNAGADRVQQLAYGLAHANEYLNHLHEKGSLPTLKRVQFHLAIDGNYFFEIAKLKALRLLWETLCTAYGISAECHITAMPSKRNKTMYDYNVNMLRTTTECMSAILGGADTIFNLPYDAVYHKDNEFGQRIALNQLVLLKEESYFDKVENPVSGSYYVETITHQMAEKALVLFKAIEKDGGFLKQLKSHTVQHKIINSANKQQERFDTGHEILVGTNAYQNESDKMVKDVELYPFVKRNPRKTLILPIIEKRLAEEMEQNRLDHE